MDIIAISILLTQVSRSKQHVRRARNYYVMIQFNSIQKTLIIPQGVILLWSWRARKIIIHKVKRTIQQTQHHQQKSLTLTIVIVINIEQL